MERSLVRINSLFFVVILINHLVLSTNARLISSMGSVEELEACPPTDDISTNLRVGGHPSEFNVENIGAYPLPAPGPINVPPSVEELEACPPTDDVSTNLRSGGPPSEFNVKREGAYPLPGPIIPTSVEELEACPPSDN